MGTVGWEFWLVFFWASVAGRGEGGRTVDVDFGFAFIVFVRCEAFLDLVGVGGGGRCEGAAGEEGDGQEGLRKHSESVGRFG